MWPHSNRPLRLALIGMSGAGKSYWTARIAAAGYPAISCDAQIESRLKSELDDGGYSGINGVAAWMGWPHPPTHPGREAAYLSEGTAGLSEGFSRLGKNPSSHPDSRTPRCLIFRGQ